MNGCLIVCKSVFRSKRKIKWLWWCTANKAGSLVVERCIGGGKFPSFGSSVRFLLLKWTPVGKCGFWNCWETIFALLKVKTLLTPIFRCSGFRWFEQLQIECLKRFEQLKFYNGQTAGDCGNSVRNNMDLAWSHLSLCLFLFPNEIDAEAFAHLKCVNLTFGMYWFCYLSSYVDVSFVNLMQDVVCFDLLFRYLTEQKNFLLV